MSDWSNIPEEAQEMPGGAKPKPPAPAAQPLILPVLQNWHVLDEHAVAEMERNGGAIEGNATVVAADVEEQTNERTAIALPTAESAEEAAVPLGIADEIDPTIVVTLDQRHRQVVPGEAVAYTLTVLNNCGQGVTYRLLVEGWIVEAWLPRHPMQFTLKPGEQRSLTVTIAPPRQVQSTAGERALAFVVRNSADSAHMTRLGASLTILPYTVLRLNHPQPDTVALTWWQKRAMVTVPLTNRSNYSVGVRLQVRQPSPFCVYSLTVPSAKPAEESRGRNRSHRGVDGAEEIPGVVELAPGADINATLQIRARRHPFFALHKATASLHVVATTVEQAERPYQPWTRTAALTLTAAPCIGPWQLTSLLGLAAVALASMGFVGLVGLILFSLTMRQPAAAAVTAPPAIVAPQPVIVAYIQAPVPQTRDSAVTGGNWGDGQIAAVQTPIVIDPRSAQGTWGEMKAAAAAPANEAPPILSAEQISAPNVQTLQRSDAAALPMVSISAPATPAPMTYATMFREIGHRYDVNWRVLAAQAYVESSFDSLALGSQGDLGLMQVHPATWREWAPTVAVTDPFDSYSNALVAAAYLDYLRTTLGRQGHPEMEWALVAYNWGIDKVLQHLESGQSWQDLAPNRQAYAIEVLRLAETIPDGR
ncbi:MAG TPA: transglycosylase SLT domain-containing protein [Caldilineaceae bacterium]|nr:transglycosylase SLT domain-containing protein [Caldilineaceae bacterium]